MSRRAAKVATVLEAMERGRVEAAGQGCYVAVHGESIDDATRHVRQGGADAVFLSVHRCAESDLPRVARFVREFPGIPAVALISRGGDGRTAERVLRLGASGVRAVVDVSAPGGWQRLRDLLREPTSPVVASVMAVLDADLRDVPPDCRFFFEMVVRHAPQIASVTGLIRTLRVVPSSLMSRFLRAGLPSPRIYLVHLRLVHAAWLFANDGLSIADVAHRLAYSSPQAFGRHLRGLLDITPSEFRQRYPFDVSVARFRATLLAPYRDRLLAFHPFGTMPGDHGQPAA